MAKMQVDVAKTQVVVARLMMMAMATMVVGGAGMEKANTIARDEQLTGFAQNSGGSTVEGERERRDENLITQSCTHSHNYRCIDIATTHGKTEEISRAIVCKFASTEECA